LLLLLCFDNIFIFSSINDLKQFQDKYIYFQYLETFSADYFENNYLVLIMVGYTGSSILRNGRIEKNNGKYIFSIEFWYRGRPPRGAMFPASSITALYLLKIQKDYSK